MGHAQLALLSLNLCEMNHSEQTVQAGVCQTGYEDPPTANIV